MVESSLASDNIIGTKNLKINPITVQNKANVNAAHKALGSWNFRYLKRIRKLMTGCPRIDKAAEISMYETIDRKNQMA